tara:strand:+ start:451 stop:723 length:273 start_codon:yes stop_codon:yes gene_type:complete
LAVEETLTDLLGFLRPVLEVNENAIECVAVLMRLLDNVYTLYATLTKKLLKGLLHLLPGDIGKCTRNAEARLVLLENNGIGMFGRHTDLK